MPFEIVRNDIANMCVDAIVNTTSAEPAIGAGVDSVLHEKAGPRLWKERQKLGYIPVGCAGITPAFGLQARYVIHTAGPVWQGGGSNESQKLRSCYSNALKLALKKRCGSVAFPLISAGNYGFPKDKALQIALSVFTEFLTEHDMRIYLVVFNREAYMLSEKLFHSVASYIDQHYVDVCENMAIRERRSRNAAACDAAMPPDAPVSCRKAAVSRALSLEEMLMQEDVGFTGRLLQLIDQTGKKDSEIYKKANLSKQHFSKIRNNPHYKPTKPTAIALAVALELDLEQTADLIGRAGFVLTNSSKFDLIIRYFIQQRNYNIMEINLTLYEFDQPLLGV